MKTLCGLLLLCLFSTASAQKFTVSVSEEMKHEGEVPLKVGEEYISFAADMKMQFGFTFKLSKVKFAVTLSKYNSRLQLVKETKLSNGEKAYGPFKPMFKRINNKVYLFYYQPDEEDNHIKLLASEIDLSDLSLKAPDELITIEQKNIGLQQVMDLMSLNKMEFRLSPDGSKLLTLWSSGINNRFFFSVLNSNLKTIRRGDETIKGENSIAIRNACLDNAGNVIVSYQAGKHARILVNGPDAKRTEQEVRLGEGSPYEVFVWAPANEGSSIRIAGSYKEGSDWLAGVFSQTMNATNFQLGKPVKTLFPTSLIEQFDNDGWANKKPKKYGLAQISLQPFQLADGSIDLIGEFRRTEMGMRTSFALAGGILNIHFKEEGVLCSRIPKARVSAGSTIGDSYSVFPLGNKMAIFYNDHEANLKQDIGTSPKRSDNYKDDVLVAATITDDGTVKREILIDERREDFLPVAEQLQYLSSSSLLVPIRQIKGFGKVAERFKWGLIDIN